MQHFHRCRSRHPARENEEHCQRKLHRADDILCSAEKQDFDT